MIIISGLRSDSCNYPCPPVVPHYSQSLSWTPSITHHAVAAVAPRGPLKGVIGILYRPQRLPVKGHDMPSRCLCMPPLKGVIGSDGCRAIVVSVVLSFSAVLAFICSGVEVFVGGAWIALSGGMILEQRLREQLLELQGVSRQRNMFEKQLRKRGVAITDCN